MFDVGKGTEDKADAERRAGREALEPSEVADDASRRADREALERKERSQAQGPAPGEPRPARRRGRARLQQPARGDPQLRRPSSPRNSPPPAEARNRPGTWKRPAPTSRRSSRPPSGRPGSPASCSPSPGRDVIRPQVLDLDARHHRGGGNAAPDHRRARRAGHLARR